MMHMTMTCSVQKVNTTPVIISVMMFAITVTTRIASAKVSEKAQLDSPREGMVLAIAMQIMTVPLSLESWSRRPGMAALRSTGSLTATPKRVRSRGVEREVSAGKPEPSPTEAFKKIETHKGRAEKRNRGDVEADQRHRAAEPGIVEISICVAPVHRASEA